MTSGLATIAKTPVIKTEKHTVLSAKINVIVNQVHIGQILKRKMNAIKRTNCIHTY